MLVQKLSRLLATAVLALAFVALTGVAGGSEANAQGRYYNNYRYRQELRQREAQRRYYQRQRFLYGNSRPWGSYRRFDRYRYDNRFDRYRYDNRFGRSPYYRRWR